MSRSILSIIPFTILIAILSKIALSYLQVFRLRKSIVIVETQDTAFLNVVNKCELESKVEVIFDINPKAFCLGIRNPKIYISTKMIELMNEKELEAILIHEKYHLKNKDSFIMFFATVVKTLFPFFPVITDLIRNYQIDREIKADQASVQFVGEKYVLISVLKKLLTFGNIDNHSSVFSPALASFDTLEERIKTLMNIKSNRSKMGAINIMLSFFSVVLLSTIILLPVHAVEIHTDTKDTLIISLEENKKNSCANTIINPDPTQTSMKEH